MRVLQRVAEGAPERREALVHLARRSSGSASIARRPTRHAGGARGASAARPARPRPRLPPELHPRLFGRLADVVQEVASSPSARVIECVDVVRRERVAVKVFAAWDTQGAGRDALARFEREVRTMRALDHPSIVPCRDYVAEGPAIVLAWMEGGTLERTARRRRARSPPRKSRGDRRRPSRRTWRRASPRNPAPRPEAGQRTFRRSRRRSTQRLRRGAPRGRCRRPRPRASSGRSPT